MSYSLFRRAGRLCALLLLIPSPSPAQKAGKLPPTTERKQSRYGDVLVEGYDAVRGKADLSGLRLTGPRTLIVVPDNKSRSTLRLHADTIQTKKENTDIFGVSDLTGNLRFSIEQKSETGSPRLLEGTAAKGIYRRASQRIELTGDVRATLTDVESLVGPGTFRAERVVVDISASPYKYTIEGSTATNDIRFTSRERLPKEMDAKQREQRERRNLQVHLFEFRTGQFQIGQSASFEGEDATAELNNSVEKQNVRLQAEQIEAKFDPKSGALSHAEARVRVRYRAERPIPDGREKQILSGTAEKAQYDLAAAEMNISGRVQAQLIAPNVLQDTGKIVADRLIATTKEPYRYRILGSPQRTRVRFTPKPPPRKQEATEKVTPAKAPETQKSRAFASDIGTVTIAAFDEALLEPGKQLLMTGKGTYFEAVNTAEKTLTRMQAERILAEFGAERTLSRAEATGNVRFRAEQPNSAGTARQIIRGIAQKALYLNNKEDREIQAQGPLRAEVQDPDNLEKPGVITGVEGDLLRLRQTAEGSEFDIESPKETATVVFVPKVKEANKEKTDKTKAKKPARKP